MAQRHICLPGNYSNRKQGEHSSFGAQNQLLLPEGARLCYARQATPPWCADYEGDGGLQAPGGGGGGQGRYKDHKHAEYIK